jgi:hypothetical protein
MHTMTLGGREVPIKLPELESVRMDVHVELTATRNGHRVWAALVGLCWDGPRKPSADYARMRFDVLAYGGAVWDELIKRGVPADEVIAAGVRCWRLINGLPADRPLEDLGEQEQGQDLPAEVGAAVDFSSAGAPST